MPMRAAFSIFTAFGNARVRRNSLKQIKQVKQVFNCKETLR